MRTHFKRLGIACMLFATTGASVFAESDDAVHTSWQLQRLFDPTPGQVQRESDNRVFIYNELPDTVIDRALNEQFNRVDRMMFTGTIVTDNEGSPIVNPDTGEPVTIDDGC